MASGRGMRRITDKSDSPIDYVQMDGLVRIGYVDHVIIIGKSLNLLFFLKGGNENG